MSALASPDLDAPGFAVLPGIRDAAQGYDGFLIDQWGVLHDGKRAYDGAVEALQRLKAAGKQVIILSNSGRRAAENAALLADIGFDPSLYQAFMSAGDDARDAIRNADDHAGPGRRCLLLARDGEEHLAQGIGVDLVKDLAQADFILLLSLEPAYQSLAGWRELLEQAAARRLPMICANPDIVRVSHDGTLLEAPGAVARAYQAMGGEVRYHGKPHGRIYASCMRLLGLPANRVAAIGDSLDHDVAGARNSGLDSIFVAGGIHRHELSWTAGQPERRSCASLFSANGLTPKFVVPDFRW
ncbi:MAG: TIGR01459 family HAD-type hydrolase [Paracoccus aminovorans]|nr:TIGR01459 family HAD-type hydrolase [Paracoccus aminovorans]